MLLTNAKTANLDKLPLKETLLVLMHQHAMDKTKSEVLNQTVINALLAKLVQSQINQDLSVSPQDHLVDVLNM